MLYKYNNKNIARKAYNDGETVLVYANKIRPNNVWIEAHVMHKDDGNSTDFDTRINHFEYHNCNYTNGYYSSFYVEVAKWNQLLLAL